jgi:TRAP-type mannitol/chloroaromatic compound transport system substrate-binding protein
VGGHAKVEAVMTTFAIWEAEPGAQLDMLLRYSLRQDKELKDLRQEVVLLRNQPQKVVEHHHHYDDDECCA